MKKLFLVLLCAGLFVACNNKNKQEEQVADTVAIEVAEEPVQEEAVVAEEPAQEQAAPAKQNTTKPKQTVKEHAQSAAENVANTAIDQAEQQATKQVVNTGKRRR
jgi:outer membrane protein assembly factor BamE (lipoprotein component of BamABCDE complex)